MTPKRSPRRILTISGDLRRRINRIAHAQGQKHEIAMRVKIADDLRRIVKDGFEADPVAAIGAYLKALEDA